MQTNTVLEGITLERILRPDNLRLALQRVEANKGAPGVDGMSTDQLRDYIQRHPGELTSAIREGRYRPKPVKRVSIPKAEKGKYRDLGIPTVIDRFVQQAVAQVLDNNYESSFSPASCGFRPYKGAQDAIYRALNIADSGYEWIVEIDLEKFFDTVNHSRLIRKLSTRIKDGRVISLIHRMLKSKIDTGKEVIESKQGLMQGGPASPICANIYLDELDKELERRGHQHVRYADDIFLACKSERAALRTLESITHFIEKKMLLKVNREKSGVRFITKGVKFLGFGFYKNRKTKRYTPTVHKKSKQRLTEALREILSRNTKMSIEKVKEKLKEKLMGWTAYFKLADFKMWMLRTDEWIRRRIRQLLWKAWKRVRTRYRALRKLGCNENKAHMWANTRKGYWHIANSYILSTTLTNDVLKSHDWYWLARCVNRTV